MYLGLLQQTVERFDWKALAFALMGSHVHLLVEATTERLSAGLWWLHWRYAAYFKRPTRPTSGTCSAAARS